MKITYQPTQEEVRANRKRTYIKTYPAEVQLEALTEAAMGRPEKLNTLLQGLSNIRETFPLSEERGE